MFAVPVRNHRLVLPDLSASLFPRPTLTLASCPLQKATLTTSCSSWPVRQKGSGREANRIPLPNDVKQSKLLVRLTNARCSCLHYIASAMRPSQKTQGTPKAKRRRRRTHTHSKESSRTRTTEQSEWCGFWSVASVLTLSRLMTMSEVEREAILASRQEEMQRFTDKRQLDLMLKLQSGRGGSEETVSKAAKRTFCSPCLRSTY